MESDEQYRLNSEKMQGRIEAFQRDATPQGLHRELACARAILEDALNRGDMSMAATLLGVITRTSRAAEKAAIRSNDLLARGVVLGIATSLLQCCADEFSQTPGWEEKFERVAAKFMEIVGSAENPSSALLED